MFDLPPCDGNKLNGAVADIAKVPRMQISCFAQENHFVKRSFDSDYAQTTIDIFNRPGVVGAVLRSTNTLITD